MSERRVKCLYPGCGRTKKSLFIEWVCAKQWAAVPKPMRLRLTRYRRRAKKNPDWQRVADKMWERCRDRAIAEALIGLGL